MLSISSYVLWMLGFCWVLEAILCIWTYTRCLIFKGDIYKYGKGSWALITGSTDGIGKSFAISLAKKGYNIVQVARNPQKLQQVSLDLNQKYGVEVLNIVKDFSMCYKDPQSFFLDIKSKTKGLDISIIINNVGQIKRNPLCSNNIEDILTVIVVNVFPIVFISNIFSQDLMKRENGGLIVNLSSVMAEVIMRTRVIYSTTKSFDLVFSNILSSEHKKVDVIGLQPGYVLTQLTSELKNMFLLTNPEECVESTLQQVGVSNITAGHWKHVISMMLVKAGRFALGFSQEFIKSR